MDAHELFTGKSYNQRAELVAQGLELDDRLAILDRLIAECEAKRAADA